MQVLRLRTSQSAATYFAQDDNFLLGSIESKSNRGSLRVTQVGDTSRAATRRRGGPALVN
jgi:hypothetical protein